MRDEITEKEGLQNESYIRQASESLAHVLRSASPVSAAVIVSSILANASASVSEQEWNAIKNQAAEPCAIPGCDCHIRMVALFDGMEPMRDIAIYEREKHLNK